MDYTGYKIPLTLYAVFHVGILKGLFFQLETAQQYCAEKVMGQWTELGNVYSVKDGNGMPADYYIVKTHMLEPLVPQQVDGTASNSDE